MILFAVTIYIILGFLWLLIACSIWPNSMNIDDFFTPMLLIVGMWPAVVPIVTLMCGFYYIPSLGIKINRYFTKSKSHKLKEESS